MRDQHPVLLLVEDVESISVPLAWMLKSHGIECHVCRTAEQARTKLHDRDVFPFLDAIILDLSLPDEPGDLILGLALSLPKPPRIVIASAIIMARDVQYYLDRGAACVLQKPTSFRELCLAAFPDFVIS